MLSGFHVQVVRFNDQVSQVIKPIMYPKECPTHTMERRITAKNYFSGKIHSYSHHKNAGVYTHIHCIPNYKITNYYIPLI